MSRTTQEEKWARMTPSEQMALCDKYSRWAEEAEDRAERAEAELLGWKEGNRESTRENLRLRDRVCRAEARVAELEAALRDTLEIVDECPLVGTHSAAATAVTERARRLLGGGPTPSVSNAKPPPITVTERQAVELVLEVQRRSHGRRLSYEEARDAVFQVLREYGSTETGSNG